MSKEISISPCPYCGAAELRYQSAAYHGITVEQVSEDGDLFVGHGRVNGSHQVHCTRCGAAGPVVMARLNLKKHELAEVAAAAIEAWNNKGQERLPI